MFKRIVIGILAVVMAATMLTGCSFFEYNTERDYKQVVAEVKSYEIADGTKYGVDDYDKYKTQTKTIYKLDLVEYVNNNYSSLSQTYSSTQDIVEASMEMLLDTELVINEVDALIHYGSLEWGITERNKVIKQVYTVIDNSLMTLKNDILDERDESGIESGESSDDSDTTYPIKSEESDDDDVKDTEIWKPNTASYPGLTGDSDTRSLETEAMRRFIQLLYDRVEDDFRIDSETQKKFDADKERIDNIINTKGVAYVYPELFSYDEDGNYTGIYYMYHISGKNVERSIKITTLQSYLTESVTVSEEEVAKEFTATLNSQKSEYTANVSAFDTAMSGSDTVLYYPNNNYFYVKHILLPFSDAQTEQLDKYKAKPNVSEEQIKDFRNKLAESIVAYPHVNGEDDHSHPMTVDEVMAEIKATMLPLKNNVKKADLAFDDLIYKYNTDPGAFDNNKGYVVKNTTVTDNSYVEEFTNAALYMRENLSVGEVYYEKIVTDYGVHIMYFASVTPIGEVSLYDYTTPGEVETYYDLLEEPIRTTRESAKYSAWEAEVFRYTFDKQTTTYESRYSNLWKN